MVASPENFPLLKELLAEQQRLDTPVARFSESHAAGHRSAAPALEPVYRDLIPLSKPRPGEQYAFEVALDSCTGCKACVSACHSLNGLDEHETWRDVGLILGGEERHPFQQTVTTACHHCADPACLNGCPVLAYEKDPVTGIVRHLDDQCIGCQYCILKCPYDVPKYNARLGIVRKCDMCQSRLAEGEAPACVQACPTHAIRIVTVAPLPPPEPAPPSPASFTYYVKLAGGARGAGSGRRGAGRVDTGDFLRAAPDPAYTQPTTRYLSGRAAPGPLLAADAHELRPQPPHWPLAIMLTLLPLAVGAHAAAAALALLGYDNDGAVRHAWIRALGAWGVPESAPYVLTLIGWAAGLLGLGASVAHLGQPLRAWRIFLGWRRSWLSREAMLFGAWLALATGAIALPLRGVAHALSGLAGMPETWTQAGRSLIPWAAVVGTAGLICSVMIYVDTRRVFWRWSQTLPRFFGSAAVLGAAALFALDVFAVASAWALGVATVAKLAVEARTVRPAGEADDDALPTARLTTARLLLGPLLPWFGVRVKLGLVCGGIFPAMLLSGRLPPSMAGVLFAGVFASELLERSLFFRAVDAPKMPGLPAGPGRRPGSRT